MTAAASDAVAAAAAVELARGVAAFWTTELGSGLLGVYLLGSLAHGGFSRRYSDIDLAVVAETAVDPPALERMRTAARALAPDLAARLSLFWADRSFSVGRFPPLDRIDYLDHAVPLVERQRALPARPSLTEVRGYLRGAPFANWARSAHHFAALDRLTAADHKPYLRVLLYPARFTFSWLTGTMASNDEAVAFLHSQPPIGLDVVLLERALECRRAAADPDALFPARTELPQQIAACTRLPGFAPE